MGGHALKNVKTQRFLPNEYHQIKKEIATIFNNEDIAFISEVPNKQKFGDLDVLYKANSSLSKNIYNIIKEKVKPHEIVHNGDVYSFDYKSFQIDFIKCYNFEMGQFYLSYGDFGGIIGRIVNKYNIKFGHEGLWINIYLDEGKTHSHGRIILSDSPKQICEFLGLHYTKWVSGFQSKQEIFDYIISSRLFNPRYFKHLAERNRKRPMYLEFVDYVKNLSQRQTPDASTLQMDAITFFEKKDEYNKIIEELEAKRISREKFNGLLFLNRGVPEKMIGNALGEFKSGFEDFELWIKGTDKDMILQKVGDFCIEFLKRHNT